MDRISVADLVQFEDGEKINFAGLEGVDASYAATREEIFKLLEHREKMPRSEKSERSSFYEVSAKSELERSMNSILNRKEEESPGTVRARRCLKQEFDRKMMRIKRIKSRAYRRIRRAMRKETVDADPETHVPHTLLRGIATHEESEETPVFSFNGPENPQTVQEELVRLAFGEGLEDNEKSFVREKEEIVNAEAPRVEEAVLPGWGSWAGPGLHLVKTRENTTVNVVDGVRYSSRKDFNRSHVVVNEAAPDIDRRFQAELPFGYTESEYSAAIRTPVSKEWNTLRIFKKLVRTKPSQISGDVVEPFRYDPEE